MAHPEESSTAPSDENSPLTLSAVVEDAAQALRQISPSFRGIQIPFNEDELHEVADVNGDIVSRLHATLSSFVIAIRDARKRAEDVGREKNLVAKRLEIARQNLLREERTISNIQQELDELDKQRRRIRAHQEEGNLDEIQAREDEIRQTWGLAQDKVPQLDAHVGDLERKTPDAIRLCEQNIRDITEKVRFTLLSTNVVLREALAQKDAQRKQASMSALNENTPATQSEPTKPKKENGKKKIQESSLPGPKAIRRWRTEHIEPYIEKEGLYGHMMLAIADLETRLALLKEISSDDFEEVLKQNLMRKSAFGESGDDREHACYARKNEIWRETLDALKSGKSTADIQKELEAACGTAGQPSAEMHILHRFRSVSYQYAITGGPNNRLLTPDEIQSMLAGCNEQIARFEAEAQQLAEFIARTTMGNTTVDSEAVEVAAGRFFVEQGGVRLAERKAADVSREAKNPLVYDNILVQFWDVCRGQAVVPMKHLHILLLTRRLIALRKPASAPAPRKSEKAETNDMQQAAIDATGAIMRADILSRWKDRLDLECKTPADAALLATKSSDPLLEKLNTKTLTDDSMEKRAAAIEYGHLLLIQKMVHEGKSLADIKASWDRDLETAVLPGKLPELLRYARQMRPGFRKEYRIDFSRTSTTVVPSPDEIRQRLQEAEAGERKLDTLVGLAVYCLAVCKRIPEIDVVNLLGCVHILYWNDLSRTDGVMRREAERLTQGADREKRMKLLTLIAEAYRTEMNNQASTALERAMSARGCAIVYKMLSEQVVPPAPRPAPGGIAAPPFGGEMIVSIGTPVAVATLPALKQPTIKPNDVEREWATFVQAEFLQSGPKQLVRHMHVIRSDEWMVGAVENDVRTQRKQASEPAVLRAVHENVTDNIQRVGLKMAIGGPEERARNIAQTRALIRMQKVIDAAMKSKAILNTEDLHARPAGLNDEEYAEYRRLLGEFITRARVEYKTVGNDHDATAEARALELVASIDYAPLYDELRQAKEEFAKLVIKGHALRFNQEDIRTTVENEMETLRNDMFANMEKGFTGFSNAVRTREGQLSFYCNAIDMVRNEIEREGETLLMRCENALNIEHFSQKIREMTQAK